VRENIEDRRGTESREPFRYFFPLPAFGHVLAGVTRKLRTTEHRKPLSTAI
jgi:hypothetical protein